MHFTFKSLTFLLTITTTVVTGSNLTQNVSPIYAKNSTNLRTKRAVVSLTCVGSGGRSNRLLKPAILKKAKGDQRITAMIMERPNPSSIRAPTRVQRKDAERVISNYRQGRPSGPKSSSTTVQSFGTIRLDEQGAFNVKNYGRFDNYQLQINGNVGKPSSVAHVNIQQKLDGYTQAKWKQWLDRGLNLSLRGSATVWVFQQVVKKGQTIQCPQQ